MTSTTNIYAIREVLDGVEDSLKKALQDNVSGNESYYLNNHPLLEHALRSVQDAITNLIQVK